MLYFDASLILIYLFLDVHIIIFGIFQIVFYPVYSFSRWCTAFILGTVDVFFIWDILIIVSFSLFFLFMYKWSIFGILQYFTLSISFIGSVLHSFWAQLMYAVRKTFWYYYFDVKNNKNRIFSINNLQHQPLARWLTHCFSEQYVVSFTLRICFLLKSTKINIFRNENRVIS